MSKVPVVLFAGLAAAGAGLGLIWAAWSGPQQRAYVISPGKLYPYDEVETMAAADGRYLILVAAVGLVAPFLAWWLRGANRGPVVLLALVAGAFAGAALTAWIGYLTGGGTYSGAKGTVIKHLPLSLHMRGLLFVEPALVTLVYGLCAAFATRDDLSRGDGAAIAPDTVSVGAGDQPQHGWGDRDGAGALQQRDLPA